MSDQPIATPTADATERHATFARIRASCALPDGEGGCWIWQGNNAGKPSARPMIRFRGHPCAVRRVVFLLQHGFEPPPGMHATGCGAPGCVGPHCIRALPRKAIMRRAARAGHCSQPDAVRNRKAASQARAQWDDATVHLVRTLPCSAAEAARLTGMSKAHVINIRAGRARTPIETPPPPPRTPRQIAAARRASERTRARRLEATQRRRDVAGPWGDLLP